MIGVDVDAAERAALAVGTAQREAVAERVAVEVVRTDLRLDLVARDVQDARAQRKRAAGDHAALLARSTCTISVGAPTRTGRPIAPSPRLTINAVDPSSMRTPGWIGPARRSSGRST